MSRASPPSGLKYQSELSPDFAARPAPLLRCRRGLHQAQSPTLLRVLLRRQSGRTLHRRGRSHPLPHAPADPPRRRSVPRARPPQDHQGLRPCPRQWHHLRDRSRPRPPDAPPARVLARPKPTKPYVLAPANGTIYEIEAGLLTITRRVRAGNAAIT